MEVCFSYGGPRFELNVSNDLRRFSGTVFFILVIAKQFFLSVKTQITDFPMNVNEVKEMNVTQTSTFIEFTNLIRF